MNNTVPNISSRVNLNQQLPAGGQRDRPDLQCALAGRIVPKVDQAEPQNQGLSGQQQERGNDPDLDRHLRLPDADLHQVPEQVSPEPAENNPAYAAQSLQAPTALSAYRPGATRQKNHHQRNNRLWWPEVYGTAVG